MRINLNRSIILSLFFPLFYILPLHAQQWNGSSTVMSSIYREGNVGIGFITTGIPPVILEKLHINGGLLLGNTTNSNSGTLRWTGTDFQGYNGTNWKSLISKWTVNGNNIYYDDGNVGIGTNSPNAKLELNGGIFINSQSAAIDMFKIATLSTENLPVIKIGVDDNKRSNLTMGYWTLPSGPGENPIGYVEQVISFTAGSHSYIVGSLSVGKTTISTEYLFDVDGKIRANEIVVNTTGADFVFENGYKLQSLKEVEIFIKENKHLPDIPTAKEVQENGVSLGEMQTKLLQKIEELTLYIIDQEKRIEELESERQKK